MTSPNRTPRAADVLARRLAEAGCRRAFGIPGGEVLTLIDALHAAGLAFHLAKHENAAGFLAEGGWHVDGAPGVLVATLGPGAANAVNVVANALQDRVPLVVLTGAVEGPHAARYTHQVFDHQALFRPITKGTFRLEAGAADAIADRVVALALDDPPGPVHLDVPLEGAARPEPATATLRRPRPAPARPAPSGPLEDARALLARAQRPLVLAGLEVLQHRAEARLQGFVTRRRAPLVTTYKAKGVLDEAHPLALGGAGLSPRADALLAPLFASADAIVLVGYDPIEMRAGWVDPWPPDAPVIELAATPPLHQMHGARHLFVGDVGEALAALEEGLPPPAEPWPDGAPAAARRALADAFAAAGGWGPGRVFEVARRVLPEDAIVTADSGAHRILLSQTWRCARPRTLLQSTGLCTMGCAVPLAAGAQLALREAGRTTPVVAFVGDAGLEMVLGELATLRDLGLPTTVVVLVDGSLALIEKKQRAAGLPSVGVEFGATDFAAVADALGGVGRRVRDAETLARELEAALARRDRFTLLACEIDRGAYDGAF